MDSMFTFLAVIFTILLFLLPATILTTAMLLNGMNNIYTIGIIFGMNIVTIFWTFTIESIANKHWIIRKY